MPSEVDFQGAHRPPWLTLGLPTSMSQSVPKRGHPETEELPSPFTKKPEVTTLTKLLPESTAPKLICQ